MSAATELNEYIDKVHGCTPSSTEIIFKILQLQLHHFLHSLKALSVNNIIFKLNKSRQALIVSHLSKKTHKPLFNITQLLQFDDMSSHIQQSLDILAMDMLNHLIALSIDYQAQHPLETPETHDTPPIPISSPFIFKESTSTDAENTLHSHSIQAAYLEYQRVGHRSNLNKNTIYLL